MELTESSECPSESDYYKPTGETLLHHYRADQPELGRLQPCDPMHPVFQDIQKGIDAVDSPAKCGLAPEASFVLCVFQRCNPDLSAVEAAVVIQVAAR